ncbi:MAG: Rid family hydrolase [Woeseiaceae bacterium]|nr:Rid family hydrolase [Woeseiaceae bacterium]
MAAVLFVSAGASADEHGAGKRVIERDGRSVTFTDEVPVEHTGYDSPWHFSHAIRAGDFVYVSGVIIGARHDEELPISKERFREETETVFEIIDRCLNTADASLEDVVKINTFHVLDGETTKLTIDQQALVIAETRARYGVEPHPAWTAVGTTGLFSPRGIVEIEVVVYAPE